MYDLDNLKKQQISSPSTVIVLFAAASHMFSSCAQKPKAVFQLEILSLNVWDVLRELSEARSQRPRTSKLLQSRR
jgi:hypothetical protein